MLTTASLALLALLSSGCTTDSEDSSDSTSEAEDTPPGQGSSAEGLSGHEQEQLQKEEEAEYHDGVYTVERTEDREDVEHLTWWPTEYTDDELNDRQTRLPNGRDEHLEGEFDVAAILADGESGSAPAQQANRDCAEAWDGTRAMWLRPSPDGELTDYTTGAQAGPTCFHEGADGVSDPDHRLIGTI